MDDTREPTHDQFTMLVALNKKLGEAVYTGGVPRATVHKNRAKNKQARKSRRENRRK